MQISPATRRNWARLHADTAGKLFPVSAPGLESVWTGRESGPFVLKELRFYLHFDRRNLQQAVPDAFCRAPEKLIYRFVYDRQLSALVDAVIAGDGSKAGEIDRRIREFNGNKSLR